MIISLANQKGGVAKTTTAITLGYALAMLGKTVLIVDCDPQGHVAVSLGCLKSDGLFRLIVEEAKLVDVVHQARPNLHILPGDKSTERAKRFMVSLDYREQILANILESAPFEFIFLDLAPSFDVMHVAALAASDFLIIPTKLDYLAIQGVNDILLTLAEISRRSRAIKDYAILPTFFDRVTKETHLQLQELVSVFLDKVWPPIPLDTHVREASAYGKTLWEYAPKTSALTGYKNGRIRIGGYAESVTRLLNI